jgi:hypothetical protein
VYLARFRKFLDRVCKFVAYPAEGPEVVFIRGRWRGRRIAIRLLREPFYWSPLIRLDGVSGEPLDDEVGASAPASALKKKNHPEEEGVVGSCLHESVLWTPLQGQSAGLVKRPQRCYCTKINTPTAETSSECDPCSGGLTMADNDRHQRVVTLDLTRGADTCARIVMDGVNDRKRTQRLQKNLEQLAKAALAATAAASPRRVTRDTPPPFRVDLSLRTDYLANRLLGAMGPEWALELAMALDIRLAVVGDRRYPAEPPDMFCRPPRSSR